MRTNNQQNLRRYPEGGEDQAMKRTRTIQRREELIREYTALVDSYDFTADLDGCQTILRKDHQLGYLLCPLQGFKFVYLEIFRGDRGWPRIWTDKLAGNIGDVRHKFLQQRWAEEAASRDSSVAEIVKEDIAKIGRIVELDRVVGRLGLLGMPTS